jgi:hypothetical protein
MRARVSPWNCILVAAVMVIAAATCSASEPDVTGNYEGIGAYSSSQMIISRVQGRIRVALMGGARDGSEPAAADCEAVAEGELVNGILRGQLIPFEGEVTSLDLKDIQRMDARVVVSFEKGMATVEGKFAHCGLQNALNGKYRKKSPTS